MINPSTAAFLLAACCAFIPDARLSAGAAIGLLVAGVCMIIAGK